VFPRFALSACFAGLRRVPVSQAKNLGLEYLPEGGFLLLPNNLTGPDAVVLQTACPRPIRFIVKESLYRTEWRFLRSVNAIPMPNLRAHAALREAADRINQGEIVCIFPEAELSRSEMLIRLCHGLELVAKLSEKPVVPVWLDRLSMPRFPSEGKKRFFKRSDWFPTSVTTVAFGKPIAKEAINIGLARERLLELGQFCFARRPGLDEHLGRATIRGLWQNQFRDAIIDGIDHRRMKGGDLVAASIALSRWIKKYRSGRRVAVVLPPGIGAVIANVAITLADKTPVNLNFTASRAALESAIRQAQILLAISAEPVMNRLPDFPWPKEVYRLEKLVSELRTKIALWRIVALLTPARLIGWLLRLPSKGGRQEAVLLFTSGTVGEPKGVVLSHRNIIANVIQFRSVVNLDRTDAIMASLPLFHSFGCTGTLWHPLMKGVRIVTYPTPVDALKNAELIEKYQITVLPTTPTFLRAYLKHSEPTQLASLKLVVAGAEKLPRELAESFEQKFGLPVLEGYGLTEAAPVVSLNLPDDTAQRSPRKGSVGKLVPGLTAQIRDPDSGRLLNPCEIGMLWLKGPNVFERYLAEDERTRGVLQDGWFKTGDLARFDEDGFLYIEGRLSRFSKIAGEMVPHEMVETKILESLGLDPGEQGIVTVVGVPDKSKGELLVLLTTRDLSKHELRKRLLALGVPNLWIPKVLKRVTAFPLLGTGKVDLAKCRQLAMER
jgi:acyl-[acyl-carrier-protein]-phospholipid O-acyltransferase / long-chain-fatty-acid--[acyl-carrier-protein] ligase